MSQIASAIIIPAAALADLASHADPGARLDEIAKRTIDFEYAGICVVTAMTYLESTGVEFRFDDAASEALARRATPRALCCLRSPVRRCSPDCEPIP